VLPSDTPLVYLKDRKALWRRLRKLGYWLDRPQAGHGVEDPRTGRAFEWQVGRVLAGDWGAEPHLGFRSLAEVAEFVGREEADRGIIG
jgi:hypothetical protein